MGRFRGNFVGHLVLNQSRQIKNWASPQKMLMNKLERRRESKMLTLRLCTAARAVLRRGGRALFCAAIQLLAGTESASETCASTNR